MVAMAKPTRRLFLRGLGGALVAAPFLGSLEERRAKAQGTPVPVPKRLIIMFTHYGCLTDRWFPANSHGPLSAEDFAGTSLEALAPHAGKILLPRGIRAMNEWTEDNSLGQGNILGIAGSYFTCAPVSPNGSNPLDSGGSQFLPQPMAASLDHVCAAQLTPDAPPLVLRVSGQSDDDRTSVSYSAPAKPFPGFGDPASALVGLRRLPGGGPESYAAVRGQSVIDLVHDDLETLERFDMSASDRRKLEAWKELLHATGGIESQECFPDLVTPLGLTDENFEAYGAVTMDRVASKITDRSDGADLFSNIAVLSALCDPARVILLKYPGAYTFHALNLDLPNNYVATRTGGAGLSGACVERANDMILTIDRYYAAKFAHLVQQLDQIDEGEGTLLDNTAAVWFQEYSDGAALNLNNMPIVQAGSCAGYFKSGCAVNVDGGASDLHRGNSSAVCEVAGAFIEFKQTGTPLEFGNAPINKYFCNLMNAIGVKAGPDGFPALGGTAEVTHYGMYDDTRDFVSGGENPPAINNPGEFRELRAGS